MDHGRKFLAINSNCAEQVRLPEGLIKGSIEQFALKAGKQLDRIADVDVVMADGVKFKFLDKPLTAEQLSDLIKIPPAGS